jgi:hypothetical protein
MNVKEFKPKIYLMKFQVLSKILGAPAPLAIGQQAF